MKKLLLLIVVLCCFKPSYAQKHLLPKFVRKMLFEQDTSKGSSFFILPVVASAPETGFEGGGSALYSFYTDTVAPGQRVSNIFGYATLTTKGQSRLSLSTNYWTSQNKYHYTALVSYINFPFNFYGIGNETNSSDKDPLGHKRTRINLTAEKRFGKNIYLGVVAGGLDYKFNDKAPGGIYGQLPANSRPAGGSVLFAGPSFVFDNRNNNTYTTKGTLVTSYFQLMKGLYGINGYRGGLFNIEASQFFSLTKKLVLGFNAQAQSLVGSKEPFFLLPSLGNDEIMRGYYNGRFRDRNLVAGQGELRYRISNRFGIVGFLGWGEVFDKSFSFAKLKPTIGGGGRYFFDVEKGLSMRVDYAYGEQRPGEARQSGLYLSLAEAF
ncbi:polymerase [Mucilaginibacter hurinus]|uniref:Polymerase n=1 Tax=Mucilaginibacter hurinus TaxID=2201324 RepID=A0A367GQ57_9SPHI|nr:polymerase [Mucilaginibacter hurinus]RCH54811.1 polymerase [Mucilaginibacter hurinus]